MTTVGYGDKTPLTRVGRMLGTVWMFVALVLVASFIAAFTTALTVNELESDIHSTDDLLGLTIATIPASTSQAYLDRYALASENYPTLIAGLQAVASGEIDAIVYDASILKYLARKDYLGKLAVLPIVFERQDYGIALPAGSAMREKINRVMLQLINQPGWQNTLQRYFGK